MDWSLVALVALLATVLVGVGIGFVIGEWWVVLPPALLPITAVPIESAEGLPPAWVVTLLALTLPLCISIAVGILGRKVLRDALRPERLR